MKTCFKCSKKFKDEIKYCPFDAAYLYPEILIKRYRLIKQIGQGGMGEIFLGEDLKLERKVAIKILSLEFSNNIEALKRFESEAKAAAKINCPNIVQIYDFDIGEDSRYFIVMEYLPGEDLDTILSREKILPFSRIVTIFKQLSTVLDLAHSQGIIHRDLKPSNIFIVKINEEEIVKVIDFGIAKIKQPVNISIEHTQMKETAPGLILGTPSYMSPEQTKGIAVDYRADVYSLGVILYECVTGIPAFKTFKISDSNQIVRLPSPTPRKVLNNLPVEVENVILKATSDKPEDRFDSCRQLVESLVAAIRTSKEDDSVRTILHEPIPTPITKEDSIKTEHIKIKESENDDKTIAKENLSGSKKADLVQSNVTDSAQNAADSQKQNIIESEEQLPNINQVIIVNDDKLKKQSDENKYNIFNINNNSLIQKNDATDDLGIHKNKRKNYIIISALVLIAFVLLAFFIVKDRNNNVQQNTVRLEVKNLPPEIKNIDKNEQIIKTEATEANIEKINIDSLQKIDSNAGSKEKINKVNKIQNITKTIKNEREEQLTQQEETKIDQPEIQNNEQIKAGSRWNSFVKGDNRTKIEPQNNTTKTEQWNKFIKKQNQ